MSFEEFIEIERTIDVGENDLVPVSIQDDEVSYAFRLFDFVKTFQKTNFFFIGKYGNSVTGCTIKATRSM